MGLAINYMVVVVHCANCGFQAMERPLLWSINTVKVLPSYVKGRVVLMGDAVSPWHTNASFVRIYADPEWQAHAMTPNQGSGAGQAVEASPRPQTVPFGQTNMTGNQGWLHPRLNSVPSFNHPRESRRRAASIRHDPAADRAGRAAALAQHRASVASPSGRLGGRHSRGKRTRGVSPRAYRSCGEAGGHGVRLGVGNERAG